MIDIILQNNRKVNRKRLKKTIDKKKSICYNKKVRQTDDGRSPKQWS